MSRVSPSLLAILFLIASPPVMGRSLPVDYGDIDLDLEPSTATAGNVGVAFLDVSNAKSDFPEGAICDHQKNNCAAGLECACLVLSRGLYTCQSKVSIDAAAWEMKRERKGLKCVAPKAKGADAMKMHPPMFASGDKIVSSSDPQLKPWAMSKDGGAGFYKHYMNMYLGDDAKRGVVLLTGGDVNPSALKRLYSTLSGFVHSFRHPTEVMNALAKRGPFKYVLKGNKPWRSHPEISEHFATGLGGASQQFPSIGCEAADPPADKMEEFFHTVQYTMMSPRQICMYHRAYENSVKHGQYHPEDLEYHGEPVPTTQADEYLAAAMRVWFGWSGAEEYSVTRITRSVQNLFQIRKELSKEDINAFCILNMFFDPMKTWPMPKLSVHTAAVDLSPYTRQCGKVLRDLGSSCPQEGLSWPHMK